MHKKLLPNTFEYTKNSLGTSMGGLGVFRLITTVITLIIGGGAFSLAGDQAVGGASGKAILVAWGISAVGVLCLVMTFYALSRIKPHLKGGIYSYASTGFGDFLGFNSAWGYWISALLATVSFAALLFGALAYFFPLFEGGTNLASMLGASALIWFYVFLVSRGIKQVTGVNAVITISKVVPLIVAIVAIIFFQHFNPSLFMENLAIGANPTLPFSTQVGNTMIITIWVFVGVEGAVAISGRARCDRDVGRATLVAFFSVLILYLLISLLSMGVLPLSQLSQLSNPSLAGVMQAAIGPAGAVLVNIGVILSLVGAMLGYTVLSSETPYEAADQGVFLKAFRRVNHKGSPIVTLIISNIIIELFLIIMVFSKGTYQFFYTLSAGMILLPYLLSAAYFLKLTFTEAHLFKKGLRGSLIVWRVCGFVGVLYSFFLGWASGAVGLTIMSLLYLPGIFVYLKGKHERNEPCFQAVWDKVILGFILALSILSIVLLATGTIQLP